MAIPELKPTGNQGELVSEWVNAPASSHLRRFRLLDRSTSEFGASSEIEVYFRGDTGKTHKPDSGYAYHFSSHEAARAVFEALVAAEHPGEVVDQQLKKRNVPYKRIG